MRKTIAIGLLVLMLLPAIALADNTVQGTIGGSSATTKCDGRGRCLTTFGMTPVEQQVKIFDPTVDGNAYFNGQRGMWHIYQNQKSYNTVLDENKDMKAHLQALFDSQWNYDRNAWLKQTLANLAMWQKVLGSRCNDNSAYDNSFNQCSTANMEVATN